MYKAKKNRIYYAEQNKGVTDENNDRIRRQRQGRLYRWNHREVIYAGGNDKNKADGDNSGNNREDTE